MITTRRPEKISAELDWLGKPHSLKIYPSTGKIPDDGHNLIYVDISELTSNDFCSFSTTPLDGTHLTGKRWDY